MADEFVTKAELQHEIDGLQYYMSDLIELLSKNLGTQFGTTIHEVTLGWENRFKETTKFMADSYDEHSNTMILKYETLEASIKADVQSIKDDVRDIKIAITGWMATSH